MKPSLQLRLSQHLALTPQLQQSIRLLQLSTLELHQEVEQMLEQNPFLEAEEDTTPVIEPMAERSSSAERAAERETERAADAGFEANDEPQAIDGTEFGTTSRDDWENGTEREDFDGIRETPGKTRTVNDADEFDERDRDAPSTTLEDHLRSQLSNLRLSELDAAARDGADRIAERGRLPRRLARGHRRPAERPARPAGRRRGRRRVVRGAAVPPALRACASCRAWSRPVSARATSPSA